MGLQAPFDEPLIDIDLNSRTIDINALTNVIGVERDHRAETLYFRVDRYFDDVDLSTQVCIVEYVNAKNEPRLFPVTMFDLTTEPGKIIFAWSVGGEATRAAGTLTFTIRFYSVNPIAPYFTYNLSMIPAHIEVMAGMQEVDYNEIYEYPVDDLEWIHGQINELQNHAVSWKDL